MKWKSGRMSRIGMVSILLWAGLAGCRSSQVAPPAGALPGQDLATARKGFVTHLTRRGPAPQQFPNPSVPRGVRQVVYRSGKLKLKGWLSTNAGDGTRRPAVVFLHGGFAFELDHWKAAMPFVSSGFVLFMPMLRGENGNPGNFEGFLGEVDDANAAGRFVASQPNVAPGKVFVAGHSVGGILACLCAMTPTPYRAAAALDAHVDMERFLAGCTTEFIPYNSALPQEVRMRNPMAFAASLRCPLRLYAGDGAREVDAALAARAQQAGKDCQLVDVGGGHLEMIAPAVQRAIAWFRQESRRSDRSKSKKL